MFTNEKPGGHGERSVAIGTIDMAVWDAVAKMEGKPLFQCSPTATATASENEDLRLCRRRILLSGAGPQKLKDEMRSYIDRRYTVVKKKIGGASLDEDLRRIDSILSVLQGGQKLASMPTGASIWTRRSPTQRHSPSSICFGMKSLAIRWTLSCKLRFGTTIRMHGDRRRPVLHAGRSEPHTLRRMRPDRDWLQFDCALSYGRSNISARSTCFASTAGRRAAHSPWRPSDVSEHRRRPRTLAANPTPTFSNHSVGFRTG